MKFDSAMIKNWSSFVVNFLKETRSETKKVIWPSRQYITAATIIVLFIVVASGIYISVIDYAFAKFFKMIIKM